MECNKCSYENKIANFFHMSLKLSLINFTERKTGKEGNVFQHLNVPKCRFLISFRVIKLIC